jgi:hypothetical protein
MRAGDLRQLVREEQLVVVGIHVVGRAPHVAHTAAPVRDHAREVRTLHPERLIEADAVGVQAHDRRIFVGVVQRQPAPAHQGLVRHRRAQHRHDVARVGTPLVRPKVWRGKCHFRRAPPHATRALRVFLVVRYTDVGLGVVGDVVVEPVLHLETVGGLELAQHVIELIFGIGVVRLRVQVGQHLAERGDVRREIAIGNHGPGIREAERHKDVPFGLAEELTASDELTHIARTLLDRGYDAESRAGIHLLALHLDAGEEEQLVLVAVERGARDDDRAADVAAWILEVAVRLLHAGNRIRSIVGGEPVIAPVVVQRAVELRRAGLGHGADVHGARPVLGGEVRALDLHFLNHVVVQGDDDAAVRPDVDQVGSIEAHGVRGPSDAVDRVLGGIVRAAAEAHALHVDRIGSDDAGHDAKQLEGTAADDRQVVDLLRAEDAFARAGLRLNHFLLGGDGDRLALLPDLEFHVDAARHVGADGDVLLLVRLEPGELDFQLVGAGEDDGHITTTIVCDSRNDGLRTGVRHSDVRAGQHAATTVCDRATDCRRARGLGKHRGTGHGKHRHSEGEAPRQPRETVFTLQHGSPQGVSVTSEV